MSRGGGGNDDSLENREVFFTGLGRKVYGGGGITPDHSVESPDAPDVLFQLRRENLIFDHAVSYAAAHEDLASDFRLGDEGWEGFVKFLREREFEFDDAELTEARAIVAVRLRAQIARILWDADVESRIIAEADPIVQKALDMLPDAEKLSRSAADRELRASAPGI